MKKAGKYILEIQGISVPITIRKSKKARNLLLHVDVDGSVELVIPRYASIAEGIRFMNRKRVWLLRQIKKQRSRQQKANVIPIVHGSKLPFFGEEIVLDLTIDPKRKRVFIKKEVKTFTIKAGSSEQARKSILSWYKKESLLMFATQVQLFNPVPIPKLRVNAAKTQWGSCNKKMRTISLNWKLALMPLSVARYVVAHEVAHLTHANHSQRFWKRVEKLMPEYKESQKWLRKHGHSISI